MPSILFITDHRLNRSPSQRFRFEQYLSYFEQQGYTWQLSELISEKDDAVLYQAGHYFQKAWIMVKSVFIRLKDVQRAKQFDIVFIQREALLLGSAYFEKQFYKQSNVIFDFDDSLWLLDVSNENKKFSFLKNPDKTKIAIANAHAVIAGNNYLANFAKPFNNQVVVIPTTVDTHWHKPLSNTTASDSKDGESSKIVIGWSGSITTIQHFELAIPVLKIIQQKYPQVEIQVIAQVAYTHPELHIISKCWNALTEVEDMNVFDIGLMTIPNDEWAKGKCGLKGLTYMACGIATVMSAVGVNTEIIQHGVNGFLVTTDAEFESCLSQLIENKALRIQLGNAGRETVEKYYSVNANKDKYLAVFNQLLQNK